MFNSSVNVDKNHHDFCCNHQNPCTYIVKKKRKKKRICLSTLLINLSHELLVCRYDNIRSGDRTRDKQHYKLSYYNIIIQFGHTTFQGNNTFLFILFIFLMSLQPFIILCKHKSRSSEISVMVQLTYTQYPLHCNICNIQNYFFVGLNLMREKPLATFQVSLCFHVIQHKQSIFFCIFTLFGQVQGGLFINSGPI